MAKGSSKHPSKRRRLMKPGDRDHLRRLLGTCIKRVRLKKGLSLQQLETLTGIEEANLRKIEGGARMPTMPTIMILSDALGVSHLELQNFQFKMNEEGQHLQEVKKRG